MNYLKYYDLERYLFEDVSKRFQKDHSLSAFDFFSIVIGKANRAESQIARRLLSKEPRGKPDLESVCRELTAALHRVSKFRGSIAPPYERMEICTANGFCDIERVLARGFHSL